jgi:hypothetical protein
VRETKRQREAWPTQRRRCVATTAHESDAATAKDTRAVNRSCKRLGWIFPCREQQTPEFSAMIWILILGYWSPALWEDKFLLLCGNLLQ